MINEVLNEIDNKNFEVNGHLNHIMVALRDVNQT